jgi:periplasmic protein TonB
MNFSPDLETTRRRWWGFVAVLGFHVVVAWALMRGLASPVVQLVKPSVQVALVAETPAPPPPPPPEPVQPKVVPPQKVVVAAPPPAIPPVVQAAATEAPSPLAITPTPPAPPPPPQVEVAALPMPPAPAVAASAARAVTQEAGIACSYQAKPLMPRRAEQEGISGSVEVLGTVRAGKVIAVEVVSARPRGVFESAARQAMLQFRCESPPGVDSKVRQVFDFKVVDE